MRGNRTFAKKENDWLKMAAAPEIMRFRNDGFKSSRDSRYGVLQKI